MGNFIPKFNTNGRGVKSFALASLALISLGVPTLQARTISAEEALQRALEEPQTKTFNFRPSPRLVYTQPIKDTSRPGLYVFDNADNRGFIVVSADDQARALLGYSDSGTFDPQNIPPSMAYWLEFYAQELSTIKEDEGTQSNQSNQKKQLICPAKLSRMSRSKAPEKSISPLLKTLWDQMTPYNNKCPKVRRERTPTGCGATALAQILKYFNYPVQGTGSTEYVWNGKTLSSDFSSHTYDWDNMLNMYDWSYDSDEAEAVAQLMYDSAISIYTDFGVDGSGSQITNVLTALSSNFGYDRQARLMMRNYYTTEEWEEIIYEQLENHGPVFYGGYTVNDEGHAFVCDGYSDGYFHINWGWSGVSNGFFSLSALDPVAQGVGGSDSAFNYDQSIVTNIYPNKGGDYWIELVSQYSFDIYDEASTLGDNVDFSVGIYNLSAAGIVPYIGLAFTNTSDNTTTYTEGYDVGVELPPYYSFTNELYFTQKIPPSLNNGEYLVRPAYKDLTGNWHILNVVNSQTRSYTATVSRRKVTFSANESSSSNIDVLETSFLTDLYANCSYKGSIKLSNPSIDGYKGTIYACFINDEGYIEGFGHEMIVSLGSEETKTIEYYGVCYVPDGDFLFCYCVASDEEGYYDIISDMVDVTVKKGKVVDPVVGPLEFVDDSQFDVNASSLELSFDVTVTNGIYYDPLYLGLFPKDGGASINVFMSDPVFFDPGFYPDITMTFDISQWVEVGESYGIALYSYIDDYAQISQGYMITIGSLTEVTKVKLSQTDAELKVGESLQLTVTVRPSEGAEPIVWKTSNRRIVSVDQNGLITALAAGEVTITATSGDASATCHVKVLPIQVTAIELSQIEAELTIGENLKLTATISPADATDKTLEWTSSDPEIASVDNKGLVTAISEGTATIEARSGDVSATCEIKVKKISQSIIWNQTFDDVHDGDTIELTAEATSNLTVTYTLIKGEGEIVGDMLTIHSLGEITIIASQTGNEMYYPAEDVAKTFIATDGILNITVDKDENAEYYTVSGVKVESDNLEPGFYIVRSGGKTFKAYIKK